MYQDPGDINGGNQNHQHVHGIFHSQRLSFNPINVNDVGFLVHQFHSIHDAHIEVPLPPGRPRLWGCHELQEFTNHMLRTCLLYVQINAYASLPISEGNVQDDEEDDEEDDDDEEDEDDKFDEVHGHHVVVQEYRVYGEHEHQLNGVQRPQVNGVQQPWVNGVRHQVNGIQVPQVNGVHRPQVNGLQRPQVNGLQRPQVNGLQRGVQVPQANGLQRPQVNGVQRPLVNGLQRPQVNGLQQPQVNGIQVPRVNGVHRHLVNGTETHQVNGNLQRIAAVVPPPPPPLQQRQIQAQLSRVLVGTLALCSAPHGEHNRSFELQVCISTKFRNHGFGAEAIDWGLDYAFRYANAHTVIASVPSHNLPALHILPKRGFVHEGRRREVIYFNGGWHDVLFFSVTENEWQRGRNGENGNNVNGA